MHDMRRKLGGGVVLAAALGLGLAPGAAVASQDDGPQLCDAFRAPAQGRRLRRRQHAEVGHARPPGRRAGIGQRDPVMTRFDIQWAATCMSTTGRGSYGGLSITLNKKIAPRRASSPTTGSFTRTFSDGSTRACSRSRCSASSRRRPRVAGTFRVTVGITDTTGATDRYLRQRHRQVERFRLNCRLWVLAPPQRAGDLSGSCEPRQRAGLLAFNLPASSSSQTAAARRLEPTSGTVRQRQDPAPVGTPARRSPTASPRPRRVPATPNGRRPGAGDSRTRREAAIAPPTSAAEGAGRAAAVSGAAATVRRGPPGCKARP